MFKKEGKCEHGVNSENLVYPFHSERISPEIFETVPNNKYS